MGDETGNLDKETVADEAIELMAGERLAEARRDSQIGVLDIAKELHLDEHKVRALERNEFDVLDAPVFVKGYLRKYAQLVKVDEADVMADYYQLTRASDAPLVITSWSKPRRTISPGPWIVAITVIAGAVVATYWWFTNHDTELVRPVTGEIAPLPITDKPEGEVDSSIESSDNTVDVVEDEPEVATVSEPVAEAVNTADASEMQLSITYSGDCWTEISDASGRRLFFDLGRSGRTVNLSGESPFNVLLGDAANVILVVNGTSFDIPAADRRGRTARLTIIGS
ncbi:MAG: helix-turn-helix domain-containing protein [Gammaproteobacteria bacterium]|jgi:cytoskeleton protein RodZ|nr:helix-turn-helix domain-containing protein [Gammaproteobacteria bacterium]